MAGPYSSAPLLVSAITAALAAEYTASLRVGVKPETDALFTIAPCPARCMSGTAARIVLNVPVRFTSSTRCQTLSSIVCKGRKSPSPALFTRRCSPPSFDATSCIAASTAALSRTSSAYA